MPWPSPEVIASWPTPNYINPPTNGLVFVLYVFIAIFLFLSTAAIAARLFARVWFRSWFGWDDVFIIMAYIIWPVGSCLTRISIIFFYYRILDHIQVRRYRWVLHFVMFFVWALLFSFLFTAIFSCVPVDQYWLVPPDWNPNSRCIDQTTSFTVLSSINTVSELVVALLPIPVVMQLQLPSKQRLAVNLLLSLGIFVSIVGAVRTYYAWMAFETLDLTWYSTPHFIAAIIEIDLAIVCACAPALRPLFQGTGMWTKFSRSSRRTSEIGDEKSRSSTPSGERGVLTSRPRDGRVHPAVIAKPGALPHIPRTDSAQTRATPRSERSQERSISRANSAQSQRQGTANRSGRTSVYGSNPSIPRRQTSTTPTSSRGRGPAQRSPAVHSRRTQPSGSSAGSISSEDEVVHRKSLEIQISYHDNGSDVRSLHVQRSKRIAPHRDGASVTTAESQPISGDGVSGRSRQRSREHQYLDRLPSRASRRDLESEGSSDEEDEKDLEKILAAARGAPQPLLRAPVPDATPQEEVSFSDLVFEPVVDTGVYDVPVSPIDSGMTSPSIYADQMVPVHEDPSRQQGVFVRHSLSTIASSNILRPQAAVAAAVAAAAAAKANMGDHRDSVGRSILTYDSQPRSGVLGSSSVDVRTATEQRVRPSNLQPSQIEFNNRRPIQRRRSADQLEWWERYAPPVQQPAPPQEGTMWSYAFDRVFTRRGNDDNGDAMASPESTTESSQENQNGRTDQGYLSNLDLERGIQRHSNLTGNSGLTSPTRSSGLRDSLSRNLRGPGQTWFDDAASI